MGAESFVESEGGPKVCAVFLRGGVIFASSATSFLWLRDVSGQLRPSISSFYGGNRAGVAKFEFLFLFRPMGDICITEERFHHKLHQLADAQRL